MDWLDNSTSMKSNLESSNVGQFKYFPNEGQKNKYVCKYYNQLNEQVVTRLHNNFSIVHGLQG